MQKPQLRVIKNPHVKPQICITPIHTHGEHITPNLHSCIDQRGWIREAASESSILPLPLLSWGIKDIVWDSYQDGWLNNHDIRNWGSGNGALIISRSRHCVYWSSSLPLDDDDVLLAQGSDVVDLSDGDPPYLRVKDWLLRLTWEPWLAHYDEHASQLSPIISEHFSR